MEFSHQKFDVSYIWISLAFALFSGFPLGVYVLYRLFSINPSSGSLPALIQLHGHIQLIGWAGLFVMGVSLFFIPRFVGTPLRSRRMPALIRWLIAAGLLSQIAAQIIPFPKVIGLVGAVAEWCGVAGYVALITDLYRRKDSVPHETITKLKPYFLMVFSGWIIFSSIHLWLMSVMVNTSAMIIPPVWHQWNADFFIAFVLFPIAYAFSIRTFSLFLQLPIIIRKPVHIWGLVYFFLTVLAKGFWMPPLLVAFPEFSFKTACLTRIGRDLFMLWMVWKLNLFVRREPSPWVPLAVPSPNPPRKGLADAGEFGHFEWAIFTAYAWLMISLVLDLSGAFSGMFGWGLAIGPDPVRHAFLLGFITLLIIGMASRMLPGFMLKKRIAHPKLVGVGLILGNVAALLRVIPGVLNANWFQKFPAVSEVFSHVMPWSGVFGIAAIGSLAWNLISTHQLKEQ